jgi:hypothetical protein
VCERRESVCVRERERETEAEVPALGRRRRERRQERERVSVCVCVCEREREREVCVQSTSIFFSPRASSSSLSFLSPPTTSPCTHPCHEPWNRLTWASPSILASRGAPSIFFIPFSPLPFHNLSARSPLPRAVEPLDVGQRLRNGLQGSTFELLHVQPLELGLLLDAGDGDLAEAVRPAAEMKSKSKAAGAQDERWRVRELDW